MPLRPRRGGRASIAGELRLARGDRVAGRSLAWNQAESGVRNAHLRDAGPAGTAHGSQRTSADLQAAKTRGKKLGRQETADANKAAAASHDATLEPVLRELAELSNRAIAIEVEHRGLGKVSYMTVARARARFGLKG